MAFANDVWVAFSADDRFAMPLTVAIRSVVEHLRKDCFARVYVLDGGVSPENREKVVRSLVDLNHPLSLIWLRVDDDLLSDIEVTGHVTVATFFRALLGRLIPKDVSRILYLDSDLVVRADVSELFNVTLQGRICAAVQDIAAPFIDSSTVFVGRPDALKHVAATKPIPNGEDLGLPPHHPYFNGGVLLIDLDRWRERSVERRLLDCIRDNSKQLVWWDQYALNAVLYDDWVSVDPSWNQTAHIFKLPSFEASYLDAETFQRVRDEPKIVHYSSSVKPWNARCNHPDRQAFFDHLDQTVWRGWRPSTMDWCRETTSATLIGTRALAGKTVAKLVGRYETPAHQR